MTNEELISAHLDLEIQLAEEIAADCARFDALTDEDVKALERKIEELKLLTEDAPQGFIESGEQWDRNGRLTDELTIYTLDTAIMDVAFKTDGQQIVAGTREVYLVRTGAQEFPVLLDEQTKEAQLKGSTRISRGGAFLAKQGKSNAIVRRDLLTGSIDEVVYSPDRDTTSKYLKLWDVSPDGAVLVEEDDRLQILRSGEEDRLKPKGTLKLRSSLKLEQARFTPTGDGLAFKHGSGGVSLYETTGDSKFRKVLDIYNAAKAHFVIPLSAESILLQEGSHSFRLVTAGNHERETIINLDWIPMLGIRCLAVSQNLERLAFADSTDVTVLSLSSLIEDKEIKMLGSYRNSGEVTALDFDQHGNKLLVGYQSGDVKLVDRGYRHEDEQEAGADQVYHPNFPPND